MDLFQPFQPLARTLRDYRLTDLPHDAVAGVTVAVVELPQAMAFAVIAGVPPVYGLYTAIVLGVFGALFTSSKYLSVGATNTQSLLIAAIVSRLTSDPDDYLRLVIALGLLKGLVQLAFAAARLGGLVRYVSRSVMIGFTAGAGVLIVIQQIPGFLGLTDPIAGSDLPGALGRLAGIASAAAAVRPEVVALGGAALVVLVVAARRLPAWVPGPLIVVAAGAALVGAGAVDAPSIGPVPRGLPALALPDLSWPEAEALLSGAVAIALLGLLESVAIASSIAQRTGQRIDADQEFFAQGFANVAGSFLQCMPGSGSFTRTALQHAVGARTRIASVVCSAAIAVVFLALAPLARHIPLAVLAAILFFIGASLVDWRSMARLVRASPADAWVCLATFAAALLLPLAYAIYAGVFLNIALYVRQASHLKMAYMVDQGGGAFRELPIDEAALADADHDVVLLQLEGDLFFGVEEELAGRLHELATSPVKVAVFRLKRTHSIDATVLFALERFAHDMTARGGHVVLCGLRPEVLARLRKFGLVALIGEDNVFEAGRGVFSSVRHALERARELAGLPAEDAAIDYQI